MKAYRLSDEALDRVTGGVLEKTFQSGTGSAEIRIGRGSLMGRVWQCTGCGKKFYSEAELVAHQGETAHVGHHTYEER